MQPVFEGLWNKRTQLQPGVLSSESGNIQAWLARFSAEVEEIKSERAGQPQDQLLQKGRTRCHHQVRKQTDKESG